MEEAKEKRQLNAVCDPGLDPSATKNISGTTGEACMGPEEWMTAITNVNFLIWGVALLCGGRAPTCPCSQELHTKVF